MPCLTPKAKRDLATFSTLAKDIILIILGLLTAFGMFTQAVGLSGAEDVITTYWLWETLGWGGYTALAGYTLYSGFMWLRVAFVPCKKP